MNNWYYNEVEMMNKHKMLKTAGATKRLSGFAKKNGQQGILRRGILFLGHSLVAAGMKLQGHYATVPANDALPQPATQD
jgi:hypothetical protein